MARYLRDKQDYYDDYDRATIATCKRELVLNPKLAANIKDKKTIETLTGWVNAWAEVCLYFKKGERHRDREKTVQEWILNDRKKDETLDKATIPSGIHCTSCNSRMEITHKDLDVYDESRVLFMFDCPKCGKSRAFYNDGEEWCYKPPKCSKCGTQYKHSNKKDGNKLITVLDCPNCTNKEEIVIDLDEKYVTPTIEPITAQDKEKYLLNDADAAEYTGFCLHLADATKALNNEQEREKHKDLYDKVAKIKQLKISEVEKLLAEISTGVDYAKFQFGKPDTGRYFIVAFSAEDTKATREEYDSKHDLLKAFEDALKETNWRVMSDGISYRAGYLMGRVRCYEKEEDILLLVK